MAFPDKEPPREPEDTDADVVPFTTEIPPIPREAGRLCNIPTDRNTLRLEHKEWLNGLMERHVRSTEGCWIDLVGHASRRGTVDRNQKLSDERVAAVETHLRGWGDRSGRQVAIMGRTGKGAGQAVEDTKGEKDNSGFYRAVNVYLYGPGPPPKEIPRPLEFGDTEWTVRLLLCVQAGAGQFVGVKGDLVLFEIEGKRSAPRHFVFVGAGPAVEIPGLDILKGVNKGRLNIAKVLEKAGIDGLKITGRLSQFLQGLGDTLKLKPKGSLITGGPPSSFKTTKAVLISSFEGTASLDFFSNPVTIGPIPVPGPLTSRPRFDLHFESHRLLSPIVFTKPTRVPIIGGFGVALFKSGTARGTLIATTLV